MSPEEALHALNLAVYEEDDEICFIKGEISAEAIETIRSALSVGDETEGMDSDDLRSYVLSKSDEEETDFSVGQHLGTQHTIHHDGFTGTVIGYYTTREGKEGVVLQQVGTRVVHVYGVKWLRTEKDGI